ncbi:MAG: hypothetical protein EZS28_004903 [Streblomastix strix]|uniref:Integrase catalytic domain-containing protein n=1 Tax=Streblomastix strix TaxID=222440 RepID=A0A5J4WWY4_9EUKA|nr:MAG: hypothetical protein EZS28_004903 [Streblomastix strix]
MEFAQTDENIAYEAQNMENLLTRLVNSNNYIMKFAEFVSNMRITPNKVEYNVLINHFNDAQIGGKTLLAWYIIYQTEAQRYNAPLKRDKSIRRQETNRAHVTEQIKRIGQSPAPLSQFPFKYNFKQYEKINQVKITNSTQIKDIKVKPLSKLQRPYFSPKLGSWEIDLIFCINPVTQRRQHYLFAININTKYLVVIPLIVDENNAKYILDALMKLIKQFTQHNRVVDSVIRTIRNGFGQDLQGLASPSQMKLMVEIYNKTLHLAFLNKFTPIQKIVISNMQDLLQINDILKRNNTMQEIEFD